MQYLHIQQQSDEVAVIGVKATELRDTEVVSRFNSELLELVSQTNAESLVVDFNGLNRVSTALINGLLEAKKRLLTKGTALLLCNISEAMRHTLRILNLDGTVFEIVDAESFKTIDEAE